ncbi:aldehyde dehydrogenase family protein [Candidatus Karelsulcia muelleri]|uniref:Aldehyde dehydrogenase family protein n=1 Tax=Candidatus Karelsulcia muelleri TaxID=336810 RepID=A0A3A1MJM0_9FLAO|nr:aldehyde dehydrogenase family protein [Candidatus Karelsulcia muelleri]RIU85696.1 aldehyde dehydrogenase family protein [Candidatus Karelsulcia muelleri]
MFKVNANAYILSRLEIKKNYDEMFNSKIEIPQSIGNEKIFSGIKHPIYTPHENKKIIGYWHEGSEKDIHNAINSSLSVHKYWSNISWADRAYIFLKAADLISGPYRSIINAATMICQSQNLFKSDTACELISFLRFNVFYANKIFNEQPRLGFFVAITPFNFTYISLPALMGNVVLWIPSEKQLYYANVLMEIFKKSGLPDGVINCLLTNCKTTSNVILKHPNFSGVTGSVFKYFYKNFIWVHPNSNPKEVSKALLYGAFESQINVSRAYIPKFLWKKSIKKKLIENINSMKLGSPRNFSNLITSLIDKISFLKIKGYIDRAQNDNNCHIIIGGKCDSSKGYFITPTVIETINPYYESMIDEIFGPVLTVYLYEDCNWEKTISLVKNLKYCFTGYIFCDDRDIISYITKKFKYYAGNIFINYNQY